MLDSVKIWEWLVGQGSLVVAYSIGVWSAHTFIKRVNQEQSKLEAERYESMKSEIDSLRQEVELREKYCDDRIKLLQVKYEAEIRTLKEMVERSDSRSIDILKMAGDRRGPREP